MVHSFKVWPPLKRNGRTPLWGFCKCLYEQWTSPPSPDRNRWNRLPYFLYNSPPRPPPRRCMCRAAAFRVRPRARARYCNKGLHINPRLVFSLPSFLSFCFFSFFPSFSLLPSLAPFFRVVHNSRRPPGHGKIEATKKPLRREAGRAEMKCVKKKSRNLSRDFKADNACLTPVHRTAWYNPHQRKCRLAFERQL